MTVQNNKNVSHISKRLRMPPKIGKTTENDAILKNTKKM